MFFKHITGNKCNSKNHRGSEGYRFEQQLLQLVVVQLSLFNGSSSFLSLKQRSILVVLHWVFFLFLPIVVIGWMRISSLVSSSHRLFSGCVCGWGWNGLEGIERAWEGFGGIQIFAHKNIWCCFFSWYFLLNYQSVLRQKEWISGI